MVEECMSSHLSEHTGKVTEVRNNWLVVAVCTIIMLAEGFDLLIYSNAIPSLMHDAALDIDRAAAGNIGSMIFLGMLLGGISAGKVTQYFGLARIVTAGFIGFTLATSLIALAQAGWQIGLLRFIAGLGLGVVLPAGLSLARKHTLPQHGALVISIVMSGIPIGGMLAALSARAILPDFGWRPLFLAGGLLGVLLVVFIAPYLARVEQDDPQGSGWGDRQEKTNWQAVFNPASRPLLVMGILATLADLLTWYGISTWLTQLMREFEIPFYGAVQLMFTLNIGAVIGSLLASAIAIRLGTRSVAMASGLVACMALLLIASRTLDGWVFYVVIALLGMSAISAQNLVNSLVADAFPVQYRAAAIGLTLGVGRLGAVIAPALGGYILAADYGPSWVLIAFAVSAFCGVLMLLGFTEARINKSLAYLSKN